MKALLYVFKILMNFIYLFFKVLKTNNKKVLFISRQSNSVTLDFKLLSDELKKKNYDVIILCKRFDNINKLFLYKDNNNCKRVIDSVLGKKKDNSKKKKKK